VEGIGTGMKKKVLIGAGALAALCALVLGVTTYLLVHRVEGSFFDSNGVRIHYTVEGEGEPVILVHGLAANADLNWRRPGVIRALSRHYRVIAFDLRGHGLSGKPQDPNAYGSEMIEDIARLMDHLKIGKAHIAGYSLGGFLLLKFLAVHPERVQSAAICAAGWIYPELPIEEIPNPYRAPQKLQAVKPLQASVLTGLKAPKMLFNRVRSWVGDQLVDKTAIKALEKTYVQFAVSQDELERNQVPAICFVGTQDGFLYLAEDLKAHMANLELVELDGSTHFTTPFYMQFKRQLGAFFRKHPMPKV